MVTAGEAHRLETLVWGGDEITLVVPAWKGWEVLEGFFQQCRNWTFREKRLTYSAGIVFCHSKAPIHSITALGQELVHMTKAELRGQNHDAFAYQVLESFDHLGREMTEEFVRRRYPFGEGAKNPLVLRGEEMHEWSRGMREMREVVPRRQLHDIVRLLMAGKITNAQEIASGVVKKLKGNREAANAVHPLEYFTDASRMGVGAWYHIGELWDYVGPERVGGAA